MRISKVGVVGAGNMGSGIAQRIAQEDIPVVMVDTERRFVDAGMERIRKMLAEGVERKVFTPERAERVIANVRPSTDLSDVADADLVIEVIFEDLGAKRDLFRRLDEACGEATVLASNTSSFSITELAGAVGRKDRFVGLHFFYHPAKNRLLEVIPGEATSERTVELADHFAKMIGKTRISVADAPGFAVNRFFVPWLNEAARLHGEGISIPTVDETAKRAFGIGMGPFLLMNVTGVPIAYHSAVSLGSKLGRFYGPCDALGRQFESGGPWDLSGEVDGSKAGVVEERLLGAVFTVACHLVEEGVASIEDTDRGAKVGLRWARGPFEMMNAVGIARAYDVVERFTSLYRDLSMPANLSRLEGIGGSWEFSFVDLSVEGGIATITFNRPEAMNAINEEVMRQLDDRFSRAEMDPSVRAIVLEGAGKAFVAGADIAYFVERIRTGRIGEIVAFTEYGHSVLGRIDRSEKLVIAKLDGLALGGGAEIALAADTIVATEKGTMGFPETGIGIYPGLGGTQRTTRYVGKEMARYLVLTGQTLDAGAAKAMGLAEYVFPSSEVDERMAALVDAGRIVTKATRPPQPLPDDLSAIRDHFTDDAFPRLLRGAEGLDVVGQRLAKAISRKAPMAVSLAADIIERGSALDLDEGLALEIESLPRIFSTADALEGLTSVLERRRPRFRGE
ncbi:MAG: 3-hydroxyacyl-CoA dehydrogenase NAD-binding domain-containing protein [Thermoplasmata archaeon]|nr:3-hydroxyacyl-CoA dehydrogenase NAD-binding domain-containing protein [Thermoplasmata archaeon]